MEATHNVYMSPMILAIVYSNKLSMQKHGLTIHKKAWANLVASFPLWDFFMNAS